MGGPGWRELNERWLGVPSSLGSPAQTNDGGDIPHGSVLSDPSLSLEDKLALILAKLSETLDKQIESKLEQFERAQTSVETWKGFEGLGSPFGPGMTVGSTDLLGIGGDGTQSNVQLLQTQLQQLLQKRQQLFQTVSSILKSLHDTSMSGIRNLRV